MIDRPVELGLVGRREIAASQQEPYRRYLVTESGISPMAIPGTAASMYTADGLEHGERGTPSSQARDHLAQLDKRRRKLDAVDYGSLWADIEGEGEVAVVTWGSCTAAVREAIERARADGVSAKLVSMRLLSPAQPDRLREALKGVKRMLVVEQTYSGQFHRYLRAEYTLSPEIDAIHRPGPLPIRPDEIHRQLVQWGAI